MIEKYVISEEQRKILLQISAQTLPDHPSRDGYSAEAIRRRLYRPTDKLVDFLNGELTKIYNDVLRIDNEVVDGDLPARSVYFWKETYTYGIGEIVYFPVGKYGSFVTPLADGLLDVPPYDDMGALNGSNWREVLNCNGIIADAQAEVTKATVQADRAKTEATNAKGFADEAAMTFTDVEASATQARQSAIDSQASASSAAIDASDAANSAMLSENSYQNAVTEVVKAQAEANRSKAEADRAKQIADGLTGGLIPKGNSTYEALPSQPSKSNLGWFWNITNDFTTDDRFVEGAGKKVPAGTDVMVIESSVGVFKYNLATGLIDLSDYAEKKYVDDTFVKISSQQEIVHGTDGIGRETQIQYNETPYGSGLAQRTSDGRLKANAPRENNDVVTKESLATNLPIASATQLGGIKIGTGLEVGADGVVNAKGGEAITAEEYQSLFEPKVV